MIQYLPRRYHTPKWQAKVTPSDQNFIYHDGTVVSSLFDLKQSFTDISEPTLNFHLSNDRHDIASWVDSSVSDHDLARKLQGQTYRWGMIVSLERHLMQTLDLPDYVAARWLKDTSIPFTLSTGEHFNSLESLASTLKSVDDASVKSHLERTPNDIAVWVNEIIGDYELAEIINESSNRLQIQRSVSDHLQKLKEAVHQE